MAANSLLTDLMSKVYTETKRPDLVSQTKQAIKAATLRLHTSDFYQKDIKEQSIQFTIADYFHQLDYKTLMTDWRALKYIRKVLVDTSANGYTAGDFLSIVTPENVLDSYGIAKEDVCYGAGSVIQIRTSTSEKYFLVGYYAYPNLVDETYESWIAREFEFAVIYDAAATVFKGIGFDEMTAQYKNDAAMWMLEVKNSNILVNGY